VIQILRHCPQERASGVCSISSNCLPRDLPDIALGVGPAAPEWLGGGWHRWVSMPGASGGPTHMRSPRDHCRPINISTADSTSRMLDDCVTPSFVWSARGNKTSPALPEA
jgi:hypothetical protein